jgi:hypothetical protein
MIVEHSIAFSIQNALEKWDVNKSLVSKWTKMYNESKDRLKDSNGTNRYKTNESNNSKVKYPDIEQFAINLFTKSRETNKAIPASVLQLKTAKRASELNYDMKCSNGWIESFKKRNSLSTRTKTSGKQLIPKDYDKMIKEFQQTYIKTLIDAKITDRRRILNMDETPICFDMPYKTTLEKKEPMPYI